MKFYFNGKSYAVPGAVSRIVAIRSSGASLPDFGITAIIGQANKGVPGLANTAGTVYETNEGTVSSPRYIEPALLAQIWGDPMAVGNEFGFESEIYHAFLNFKLGGGSSCYIFDVGMNTRTSFVIIDSTSGTPLEIALWSMEFGVHTNDIYFNVVTGAGVSAIEITKPRNTLLCSENVLATNNYVKVDVLSGLDIPYAAGETVHLVDKDHTLKKSLVVDSVDTVNKIVYFTTVTSIAPTILNSARLFQMDLDDAIEDATPGLPIAPDYSTTGIATLPELKEWIEDTGVFGVDITSAAALLPIDVGGFVGALTLATANGTSPVVTPNNWGLNLLAFTPIAMANQIRYIVAVNDIDVTSADAVDRSWLSNWQLLELTLRTTEPKNPVDIFTGCNLEDTFSADSAVDSPATRAAAMNNDHFHVTDIGLGGLPSYVSFSPYVVGLLSANIVNFNLTNKPITVATIEQERVARETVVGPRILAGVITVITKPTGNFIARGVNTLQDNVSLWTTDNKTHSIMQRNLADYCDLTLVRGLDNDVIGRNTSAEEIKAYVNSTAQALIRQGYVIGYAGCTVVRVTAGFIVDWTIRIDEETDWIGLTTNILVD